MKRPDSAHLEEVREELRRRGYLSHSVERYLLQDALRPVRWQGTVLRLAVKLGILGGACSGLLSVLLFGHWNESLRRHPLDAIPLFLHLVPPWFLAFAGGFVLLSGLLTLVLRRYPGLRLTTVSLGLAVGGMTVALILGLWIGWQAGLEVAPTIGLFLGLGIAVGAYLVTRWLYQGLLALAIRLTDRTPQERAGRRRWVVIALAVAAALSLSVPASLMSERAPVAPSVLPTGPGGRVLLVGIDGLLASELDYLLDRGDLPALGRLTEDGGTTSPYRRPVEEPAAVWTTLATGLASARHGVAAVDSFRPRGLETSISVSGPFRPYWERVEVPLGLAEHRPVLSNRRHAATFWELASRGGDPILAVNWWSTYPARETAGRIVAHGAYQLLADGAPSAVAPEEDLPLLEELREQRSVPPSGEIVDAALGEQAGSIAERAVLPEDFYRRSFLASLRPETRAAVLYLPALDLAADDWPGGEIPFADLVRAEVQAADQLIERTLAVGTWDTVVFVADPGRRASVPEGRVLLWRREGCPGAEEALTLEEVAAGLFRALGLAQSRELPEPPEHCLWKPAAAIVETFGRRAVDVGSTAAGDEYLESLQALGYL